MHSVWFVIGKGSSCCTSLAGLTCTMSHLIGKIPLKDPDLLFDPFHAIKRDLWMSDMLSKLGIESSALTWRVRPAAGETIAWLRLSATAWPLLAPGGNWMGICWLAGITPKALLLNCIMKPSSMPLVSFLNFIWYTAFVGTKAWLKGDDIGDLECSSGRFSTKPEWYWQLSKFCSVKAFHGIRYTINMEGNSLNQIAAWCFFRL